MSEKIPYYDALEDLKKTMVEHKQNKEEGNITRAARSMGIPRPSLYDMLRKFGIKRN